MAFQTICRHCGGELRVDRFSGLCPGCLWNGLIGPEDPDDDKAAPGAAPDEARPGPRAQPGTLFTLPGHEVLGEIARGGMGIVYRARQLSPGRLVALKMLLPQLAGSPGMRERFRVECHAVARLEHPAILPIHEVGEHDGLPYFTMKLALGGTLAARRDALDGRFRDIATLVATLAQAMQFAHEHGVLHRDLKPGNILFDEADHPFIADFGLAKFTDLTPASDDGPALDGPTAAAASGLATRSHSTLGTPQYLAPETANGGARDATTASDVYGLGAILYELLSGRPPFAAGSLTALLRQIAEAEPVRPSLARTPPRPGSVPRDLEVICLKCLAKAPSDRYASARALAEDLGRWLAGTPIVARPAGPAARAWAWARRNPVPATLGVLLAAALLAGALLQARANRQLRAALDTSRAAQAESREHLRQSLIAQARAQRQTRQPGQRVLALDSAARSARIAPSADATREAAAALAVPDLQLQPRPLPAFFAGADSSAEFSADLRHYFVGHAQGGVAIRRTSDGAIVRLLATDAPQPAHDLRLSPDGQTLFAAWLDGSAALWAVPSLESSNAPAAGPLWQRGPMAAGPARVAFHPGPASRGCLIVLADGTVRWHASPDTPGLPLAPPPAPLLGAAFAPDGQHVALALADGSVELRDWPSGRPRWTLAGDFNTPDPAWSPDGRHLAIGSRDRHEIAIVDLASGKPRLTLRAAGLKPVRLAFHPAGQMLASVGHDRRLQLWDTVSGAELLQLGAAPRALRFSTDGQRLALASGHLTLALADLAPASAWRAWPAPIGGRGERASSLAVHPDGSLLATADANEVQLWDTRSRSPVLAWAGPAPDGSRLFFATNPPALLHSAGSHRVSAHVLRPGAQGHLIAEPVERPAVRDPGSLSGLGPDHRLWLFERRSRRELAFWPEGDPARQRVLPLGERFNGATLSPDGQLVATLDAPLPGVTLRDAASGRVLRRLDTRGHATAAFSPDGRWLVTGTADEYRFWDPATGEPGPHWPARLAGRGHGRFFFSPAGDRLALLQDRDALLILDPRTRQELVTLEPPVALDLVDAAWSPDATRLYLLDGSHRVYEWALADLQRDLKPLGLAW